LNNIIGRTIHLAPENMLLVQPSNDAAKLYSKNKIAPMIEACAELRKRVRTATARKSGNTMTLKEFPGGFLKITGANSGKGLRSDNIRLIFLDEVDAYPDDVAGEGNPIDIVMHRADSFADYRVVMGSTYAKPRGFSRLEWYWNKSDQRRFHVPCPHCGFFQVLKWRDVDPDTRETTEYWLRYEKNAAGEVIPESVHYLCQDCRKPIAESFKSRMLERGEWIPTFPERKAIRGYHINGLYLPWRHVWPDIAQEWVDAQGNPEKMKAFVNLRLGETYDDPSESVESTALEKRKEVYAAEVPDGVAVLVASVDVQGNRLEAQIVGFGAGQEAWLIAHEDFFGVPDDPDTSCWEELEEWLLRARVHARGFDMKPAITLIDSSAYTKSVYDYVKPRQHAARRVFAIKGQERIARAGLVKETIDKKIGVRLWMISTSVAKDLVLARLRIQQKVDEKKDPIPTPGLMHFHRDTTKEYLEQLASEKKVTIRNKRTRTTKQIWQKTRDRNEALDLMVYAHAGLAILGQHIDRAKYGDLAKLAELIKQGHRPENVARPTGWKVRKFRIPGQE